MTLGEIDSIRPQTIPARMINPFSFHICIKEIRRYTVITDNVVHEKGILRLLSNLPSIISIYDHILPTVEAICQCKLSGLNEINSANKIYEFIMNQSDIDVLSSWKLQ